MNKSTINDYKDRLSSPVGAARGVYKPTVKSNKKKGTNSKKKR